MIDWFMGLDASAHIAGLGILVTVILGIVMYLRDAPIMDEDEHTDSSNWGQQ